MSTNKHSNEVKLRAVCNSAWKKIGAHPLFSSLHSSARFIIEGQGISKPHPSGLPLVFDEFGYIYVRPSAKWSEEHWMHGFAICLLNLGMDHHQLPSLWTPARHAAIFAEANKFIACLKFINMDAWPADSSISLPSKTAQSLEVWIIGELTTAQVSSLLPYPGSSFFWPTHTKPYLHFKQPNFSHDFGLGVSRSIEAALDVASGRRASIFVELDKTKQLSVGQHARSWLLANFPLLSGIASYFPIIESMDECRKLNVSVGMINVTDKKIYLNPGAGLTKDEWIWVLAHEYLHAGLNHGQRQDGRHALLWNIACDFAINIWLEELRIGVRPAIGVMYDPQFKGWSAERIYEFITQNIRMYRKCVTLAGDSQCDMIGSADGVDTDAESFCRGALVQGMFRHQSLGRGLLPADLIETINALEQPTIPWDVKLGRWFDLHVPFPENKRSYMRPSRRQSSTPDTPLPRTIMAEEFKSNAHTFGVVLDTSGSMSRSLLAKALGTIAQYALAHEVPGIRLIFCDAHPYDAGYIRPDDLLHSPINVHGRGGTQLQPAVELFEQLTDFPNDAPLLILTDGFTDVFHVKRTHAFVLPKGRNMPFATRGDVFYIS
jgi:predicted metal-dependent peptidase